MIPDATISGLARQLEDLRERQTETNDRLDVMDGSLSRIMDSRSVDSLRVDWLIRSFRALAERLGAKLPDEGGLK